MKVKTNLKAGQTQNNVNVGQVQNNQFGTNSAGGITIG
jgi:hypothetical protein